jgi:uncharacterized protein with ParB-like and HNH nuclease domain
MKPSIQTLGQILYSPSQYVIPVFQRHYRWETPQWNKLWESLKEIQKTDKKGNHFMGFLVFIPELPQPGQNTRFHVIDGQQRLTTLSLLLVAIRNTAKKQNFGDLREEIHNYYLIHPIKKGEHYYRLLPKEHDHDNYLAIVDQQSMPQSSRLAEAVNYFEGKVIGYADNDVDRLRNLFNIVTQRLEFMCATLEVENAYNIFKSLNSTGVPLNPSDLIRNFVFMHVPPEASDEFDRRYWNPIEEDFTSSEGELNEAKLSGFFRDFLISQRKSYVAPSATFSTFEARYEATGFSPQDLAVKLKKYGSYYLIISGGKTDTDSAVTSALKGLNSLQSSTTYPMLLSLFENRALGIISSEDLALAIRMLTGFIFRRFVCGESSRGYGKMFIKDLGESPVAKLEEHLIERGWPTDERFKEAFTLFPLYTRGYTKLVLESLERARGHKEPADLSDTEVEHIMPRTLSDAWRTDLGENIVQIHNKWLHTPGNLTLTAYNIELWNHPFPRKSKRYSDSNIVLTRELSEYKKWGEDEIKKRGELLAKQSAKIWIGTTK